MKGLVFSCFLAAALASMSAMAQTSNRTEVNPESSVRSDLDVKPEIRELGRFMIAIDLVPGVISVADGKVGGGLSFHTRIGNNFGIGVFGTLSDSTTDEETSDDLLFYEDREYRQLTYGAEMRAYLNEFGKGFYAAAGYAQAELKAQANAEPINASNFRVEDTIRDDGFLGRFGYAFSVPKKTFRTFVVDIALEYGPGNEWTTSADNTGRYEVRDYQSAVNFKASLGATF